MTNPCASRRFAVQDPRVKVTNYERSKAQPCRLSRQAFEFAGFGLPLQSDLGVVSAVFRAPCPTVAEPSQTAARCVAGQARIEGHVSGCSEEADNASDLTAQRTTLSVEKPLKSLDL
jgi:hypothetical protein